jgi:hypothetical protein
MTNNQKIRIGMSVFSAVVFLAGLWFVWRAGWTLALGVVLMLWAQNIDVRLKYGPHRID